MVVNLPDIERSIRVAHANEKQLYPEIAGWTRCSSRKELEERHPFLLDRIVDNLCKEEKKPKISITNWENIYHRPEILQWLISADHVNRNVGEYDLSRPMRKSNAPSENFIYPRKL